MNKIILFIFLFSSLVFGAETAFRTDDLSVGRKSDAEKNLYFKRSSNKVGIRWSETNGRMEFSNDGSNYRAFGSGGGGGAGVNLLADFNFDFETDAANWTASEGGTLTIDSTSPLNGLKSAVFDATATSQTVCTAEYLIPAGFEGRRCQIHIPWYQYTGTLGDYQLKVYNGEDSELVSLDFSSTGSTATAPIFQTFSCPALNGGDDSDKLYACIQSTTNGGALEFDDVFLGSGRNTVEFGSATSFGTLNYAGTSGCDWISSDASQVVFAEDTGCPSPSVTGQATAPSTKIPGITFATVPKGKYYVVAEGRFSASESSSGAARCTFDLWDGTNRVGSSAVSENTSRGEGLRHYIGGVFEYTASQTNLTFQVRVAKKGGNSDCRVRAAETDDDFNMMVFKYPTDALEGNTYDTIGWRVDANISGGTVTLGTSSVSSYAELVDASLTLTNNTGRGVLTAEIPCSTTNASTGTTCSSGSEGVGVAFTIPKAQDVLACVSFAHEFTLNAASTSVFSTFQIVETPNNAQTISQEGKGRITSGFNMAVGTGDQRTVVAPHRLCGTFSFSSAGKKTLRLMYEQEVSGVILGSQVVADADASNGQQDIHWEVYPINESMPTPVFDDLQASLSLKVDGGDSDLKIVSAYITNSGTPTLSTQTGSWISSIDDDGIGDMGINLVPGAFTSAPACSVLMETSSGFAKVISANTTSIELDTVTHAGDAVDANFWITCLGAK